MMGRIVAVLVAVALWTQAHPRAKAEGPAAATEGAPATEAADQGPTFLNGNWSGQGTILRDKGITACPSIATSFDIKDNIYRIVADRRSCLEPADHDEQPRLREQVFPPLTVAARDGRILVANDRQVGTYGSDFVEVRYEIPIGNILRVWHTRIVRKGAAIISQEDDSFTVAGSDERKFFLVYTGMMTRQN